MTSGKCQFGGESVRLGDICRKGKSSLRLKDLESDGRYAVYGASGIVGMIDSFQNDAPYVSVIKDGAGVGRAFACEACTSVLGTMQALLPKEGVERDYLLHLVRSIKLGDGLTGSTIPHIYFKDYCSRQVFLPSLDVQRRIVRTLSSIEDQILQIDDELSKLDILIKSRFVEMFGDQRTNSLDLPVVKLGEAAFVGSSKRVFKDELVGNGIPFFRGTEIGALAFGGSIEPELFITKTHYDELVSHTGKPEIGDLLMPSICPDGQIWLVNTEEPFYFKDGRVLWVKPDRTVFNSTYLQYAMRNRFISDFETFASGTTFAELKVFILKSLAITLPPTQMQKEFAAFVQQVDKLRVLIQQQKEKLQMLYDSLAQEYFAV